MVPDRKQRSRLDEKELEYICVQRSKISSCKVGCGFGLSRNGMTRMVEFGLGLIKKWYLGIGTKW